MKKVMVEEELNARGELAEVFKSLDQKYGAGNYRLRKISRLREGDNTPSLTLRFELDKLELKVGDMVLITVQAVQDRKKIVIEPL